MTVLNLTSRRAERAATNLAKRIQEVCSGEDMTVVACALMGMVSSLSPDLAAQVCATVAASLAKDPNHGNDHPKSIG